MVFFYVIIIIGDKFMGFFDFLKLKEQRTNNQLFENSQDLENEYLTSMPSDNIYGFQKKFYMQSNRLLKVFGNARNILPNRIKLLIITDTHNSLDENELNSVINEHPDFNACLLLGDHSDNDIKKVLNYISKDKIYALLGNHDTNYIDNYNLNNFNGQIIDINGVKLLGIQGSFKYKPVDFPSFTQEDSVRFLKDKEPVDILISHDGPFDDNMINNPAHQGLFGITYYLFKNKVKYNIHGHLHNEFEKRLANGTIEKSLYGITYIELE